MFVIAADKPSDVVKGDKNEEEAHSESEESIAGQGVLQNDAVIALDDIVLTDDTIHSDDKQGNQDKNMEDVGAEIAMTERKETSAEGGGGKLDNGADLVAPLGDTELVGKEETGASQNIGRAEEDEGISLDGEGLDATKKQENEGELSQADDRVAVEEGTIALKVFCSVMILSLKLNQHLT